MIPKIIHIFCYKCKAGISTQIVREKEALIESIKVSNPDFEVKVWDETNFDINLSNWTRQAEEWADGGMLVDYFKPWVLYNYGGIYMDADCFVNGDLSPLLDNKCFFGLEHDDFIGTAIIGAEKGNPLVKELLDMYQDFDYIDKNNNRHEWSNPIVGRWLRKILDVQELKPALYNDGTDRELRIYDNPLLYPNNKTDGLTFHRGNGGLWTSIDGYVFKVKKGDNVDVISKNINNGFKGKRAFLGFICDDAELLEALQHQIDPTNKILKFVVSSLPDFQSLKAVRDFFKIQTHQRVFVLDDAQLLGGGGMNLLTNLIFNYSTLIKLYRN